jgi:osmotically inducible protein OsmC
MPVSTSKATWEGDLKRGKGSMTVGNDAWTGPYSFASRFEAGQGTNPEELIAAAHAGCFSMALSHALAQAGHTPRRVETTAKVHLEKAPDGFVISRIELETQADIPGIDERAFQEQAETAKKNCPVSRVLSGAQISLTARLVSGG